jgi:hypothetical protein
MFENEIEEKTIQMIGKKPLELIFLSNLSFKLNNIGITGI